MIESFLHSKLLMISEKYNIRTVRYYQIYLYFPSFQNRSLVCHPYLTKEKSQEGPEFLSKVERPCLYDNQFISVIPSSALYLLSREPFASMEDRHLSTHYLVVLQYDRKSIPTRIRSRPGRFLFWYDLEAQMEEGVGPS